MATKIATKRRQNTTLAVQSRQQQSKMKLYIDIDLREGKDGKHLVKLFFRDGTIRISIGVDVRVSASNFIDGVIQRGEPNFGTKNRKLSAILELAEREIQTLYLDDKTITKEVIKQTLERCISPSKARMYKSSMFLVENILEFAELKNREKTKTCYIETAKKVSLFSPKVKLDDITPRWLTEFDTWLEGQGCSTNTRGRHFREIRAVVNFAIGEERTSVYGFRKFKIPKQETAKRSLTIDELRELYAMQVEKHQERYRDMFFLSFFLVGINLKDLLQLGEVENGRIEYYRSKTRKRYSVKVEPEAQAIIDKYKGKGRLLNILDSCTHDSFLHRMDKELKLLGEVERKGLGGKKYREPRFPKLSSYWARHTWASIAYELDIPDHIISQALGHSPTNTTTAIYIRRSTDKVDEANRKVIDCLINLS